jgi:hypothetical protein
MHVPFKAEFRPRLKGHIGCDLAGSLALAGHQPFLELICGCQGHELMGLQEFLFEIMRENHDLELKNSFVPGMPKAKSPQDWDGSWHPVKASAGTAIPASD